VAVTLRGAGVEIHGVKFLKPASRKSKQTPRMGKDSAHPVVQKSITDWLPSIQPYQHSTQSYRKAKRKERNIDGD
jgi:hypothetical protein